MKKFRQKKSLGQHFLKDKNVVKKIADLAEIQENELVWEVGPGKGILTQELLLQTNNLTCFEIDDSLYPILIKKFGTNINLIGKDILKINWKEYLNNKQLKIVANLPYQITSPFLFKVTENAASFKRVVVMIQKEVAERINAGVGTKDYGKLSLKMQFYFNVEYGFTVKPHLFIPPPKVDSAVIILTPRKDKPILEDEKSVKIIYTLLNNTSVTNSELNDNFSSNGLNLNHINREKNKFINNLNIKLSSYLNQDFITREKDEYDKRMIIFKINKDLFRKQS